MVEEAEVLHDIYYSASFIFYILKFFGFAFYSFNRRTLKFHTNCFNYFILVTSIALWIILIWFFHLSAEEKQFESGVRSNLLDDLWQNQYLIQHYLAIGAVVFVFCRRKNIENFLKMIYMTDELTKRFDWTFQVKHSRYPALFVVLGSAPLMMTYMVISIIGYDVYGGISSIKTIFRVTVYFTVNEFYFMISMQFILSVYCVYARLKALKMNAR